MKIWIKYLIGTVLGVVTALFIPFDTETSRTALQFFTELSIRIGRYFLLPTLFFSMTIAVAKLRTKGLLIKTGAFSLLVGIGVTVVIVILGTLSALIINLPRIPISGETATQTVSNSIIDYILMIFPLNGFGGLFEGNFLIPLFVLAGLLGASFSSDPLRAKPVYAVFDSLSKITYSILSFFIDFLSIGVVAISCTWFISMFEVLESGAYTGLIILLSVDTLLVLLVLLPLLLKVFSPRARPYKVLYACLSPIMVALFSGDANLALSSTLRHAKDSLGVQRKVGAITIPMFSAFIRSGSALVVAVSFIAVLRSYSSLEISFFDVLWITSLSVASSFFLGGIPIGGPFIALTVLCSLYGRGFEAGYLLLRPVAFIICTFATVIDVAVSMFCSFFIAQRGKMTAEKSSRTFI